MKQQKEFHVTGQVQGVGFRYFVWQVARQNGLTGFARNEANGEVTVVVQGSNAALQLVEAALWKGSPMSHVDQVTEVACCDVTEFDEFSIR